MERVLLATSEVLAQEGYAGLRIEDVAARSGVNKTTIYRRWPTKLDLVRAMVQRLAAEWSLQVNPGETLKESLLNMMANSFVFATTPKWRGIMLVYINRTEPLLSQVTDGLRESYLDALGVLVREAGARGELPRGVSPGFVLDLVMGAVLRRLFRYGPEEGRHYSAAVLDVVFAGLNADRLNAAPLPGVTVDP